MPSDGVFVFLRFLPTGKITGQPTFFSYFVHKFMVKFIRIFLSAVFAARGGENID